MKITKKLKMLFFYVFLVDFLIAIQIAIAPRFANHSIVIGNFRMESFVFSLAISFSLFLFFLKIFHNTRSLKRTIQIGLAFMIVGNVVNFFGNADASFIFGRTMSGFGAGMIIVSELGMIHHSYFEKIKLFWAIIFASLLLGLMAGMNFLRFFSGPNLSELEVLFVLSIAIPILAIIEFNKYSERGVSFIIEKRKKIGILGMGHFFNQTFDFFFDYVLYSFVIWKYGILWGSLIMGILILVTCYFFIIMYDWSKKDWLGLEAIKELKQSEKGSFLRKVLSKLLRKGDWVIFVFLSIQFDAFVTTIYMRKGAHNYSGFSRRDWKIFFASFLVSFIYWNSVIVAGVSLFDYLFS